MAKYISVRGWIECEREDISKIFQEIDKVIANYKKYGLPEEFADIYRGAWVCSEKTINLLDYVFFGADIKEIYLDFIIDQFKSVSYIDDIDTYAFITDDEEEIQELVRFVNGEVSKCKTNFDRSYDI